MDKNVAEALLDRLLKEERLGYIESNISEEEMLIIRNAFVEVEKEIEDWEFHARIGTNLEDVKSLSIFKRRSF